jgi:DnaJ-class molecular chaperone
MPDYYNVLGVGKNATEDEIKKEFRRLAREFHPDKGGDKEKFQEIQEAYEVLSDTDRRKEYDSPNVHDNFTGHFPFSGFPFGNFFNTGPSGPQKLANRQYNFKISLRDAYFGITKKFRVKRDVKCGCNVTCNHCGGEGIVTHRLQNGPFVQMNTQKCNKCSGRGITRDSGRICKECSSTGNKSEERLVELDLNRGVENGKKFVIDGWGDQSSRKNEISGDLVIEVIVDNDSVFTRSGLDLLYITTITLRESIVGKKIIIPHFDGDYKLDLRGFGIVNPNKQYTIFNKGMISVKDDTGKGGNLHLRFNIQYPDGSFDDDQLDILEKAFMSVGLA